MWQKHTAQGQARPATSVALDVTFNLSGPQFIYLQKEGFRLSGLKDFTRYEIL